MLISFFSRAERFLHTIGSISIIPRVLVCLTSAIYYFSYFFGVLYACTENHRAFLTCIFHKSINNKLISLGNKNLAFKITDIILNAIEYLQYQKIIFHNKYTIIFAISQQNTIQFIPTLLLQINNCPSLSLRHINKLSCPSERMPDISNNNIRLPDYPPVAIIYCKPFRRCLNRSKYLFGAMQKTAAGSLRAAVRLLINTKHQ